MKNVRKGVGLWAVINRSEEVLFAADDALEAGSQEYWPDLDDDQEIIFLKVPFTLAGPLRMQGTTNQVFSDGYDAYRAAKPYIGD